MRNKAKNCKRWKRKTNRKIREDIAENMLCECIETMASKKCVGVVRNCSCSSRSNLSIGRLCVCTLRKWCCLLVYFFTITVFTATAEKRKVENENTKKPGTSTLFNSFIAMQTIETAAAGWRQTTILFAIFCSPIQWCNWHRFFRTGARKNFYLEFIAQKRTTKQWVECHVQKGHSWQPIENGRKRKTRRVWVHSDRDIECHK